jgi:hypothetical protein
LSLFRFKIWWMAPKMGPDAAGVPAETQMLLLESRNGAEDAVYALVLPVLDGDFRASLQGAPGDELQFCFESGRQASSRLAEFHGDGIIQCVVQ